MTSVSFFVNGEHCTVSGTIPRNTTLNAYIRYALALPGTKAMCREGGCGACVVSVRARRHTSGDIETFSVNSDKRDEIAAAGERVIALYGGNPNTHNLAELRYQQFARAAIKTSFNLARLPPTRDSALFHSLRTYQQCLVLVFSCQGWEITTIEAVGNRLKGYDEIQKRTAAFNATQCGYCTPGWEMHLHSLKDQGLTMKELEKSFAGNTCRCTGFRPILDVIKSFAIDASPQLCSRVKDMEDLDVCSKTAKPCTNKCSVKSHSSDWSTLSDIQRQIIIHFDNQEVFVKVYKEDEIFDAFKKFGTASYMLIDGNTSKGVSENFEYPQVLIDISDVESLKSFYFDQNLILGANISLEDCIKIFRDTATSKNVEFSYLTEFAKHFELIAHTLVRNIGSVAGNLMTKHAKPYFQSDVFISFAAVRAMVVVRQHDGSKVALSMTDFLKFDMLGKLILCIELPPLNKLHTYLSYKIMPRNQNALAIVNAAFMVKFSNHSNVIKEVSMVYGNISPDFIYATKTENYLKNKNVFNNETLQGAILILSKEIVPVDMPPKSSPNCRKKLAIGLFYKFILNISPQPIVQSRLRSGGYLIDRPVSKGTQDYQTKPSMYPVSEPVQKYEAMIQSSGEAEYINDMPSLPRQVFAAFVLSTIHNGDIDTIDTYEVTKIQGVLNILTAKDIPGKNSFMYINKPVFLVEDEEILASKTVKFYGQPVAIVVADSEVLAEDVAKKVKVTYKNISTNSPVLTVEKAAKDSKRYLFNQSKEPKQRGNNVKKVIKGSYSSPLQFSYFMEPMTCLAVPIDKGLEVYDSSQWIDLTQAAIAQSLGISRSEVHVRVRRLGGAFGGKITRNIQVSAACALVAKNMDRPCRFIVPLKSCMSFSGKRTATQWDYEVGVDNDGKIQYLHLNTISNKGCGLNDNYFSIVMTQYPNCYKSDYIGIKSATVLTDMPCNSFVRAPGSLEAISCMEHIMEHISMTVQKDAIEVRLANMEIVDNKAPEFIKELKEISFYDQRSKEIESFNLTNRWMKKGIKMSVMQFRLKYQGCFTAIVSIYRTDGTVSVSSNGIEIGQGINTKAAQVCAYELGIPLKKVTVLPCYTFVTANNQGTIGSFSTECVCHAIIEACNILKKRLEPIKQNMENATWEELIVAAAEKDIDLVAKYMMSPAQDKLSGYSIFGVAALEVQLDILTGRFQILRVDILEETGQSINPQVDIGQIEGAFVQGLGLFTCEKIVFDNITGKLLTNRSLNYHVPLAMDIPADFRIKLKYDSTNPKGILGSKAVGELGVCTSNVVTLALRHCIMESRKDSGYDPNNWINIDIPYDTESILKALNVKAEEMVVT